MAFVTGSVVNVALPALQAAFDASAADLQWIVNGYALPLAALILVGGSLGDRFGLRRVFVAGIAIFSLASIGCALADSLGPLLAARVVQGMGGALLVPSSLALLSGTFPDEERGRAIGTWAGFAALTSAGGPLLGGWLVDALSWRWIFLVVIPFAGVALVIALWKVPEGAGSSPRAGLDLRGAAIATCGLAALTFGLIESSKLGFGDRNVVLSLAGGLVLLALFLRVESRRDDPMMPLDLFRSRSFSGANLLTLLLYFALGSVLFLLPFNLIQVRGYSATEAGAAFLPFTLLMGVLSRWSGGLVDRFGARRPLVVGPLIVAAGFGLLALPGVEGAYLTDFLPGLSTLGLGMAVSVAPLTTVVMTTAGRHRAGIASGVNNAASRVAWLLSVALLGTFVVHTFGRGLEHRLAGLDLEPATRARIYQDRDRLAAIRLPGGLDPESRAAVKHAIDLSFLASFRLVMAVAGSLAVASSVAAALAIPSQESIPSEESPAADRAP